MKTQQDFLEGKSSKRLGIFPEGTTTNNKCLLPFKQGAFYGLSPVKPIVLKVTSKYISPTYDCVGFLELALLLCFQLTVDLTVIELPVFTPNDFLWT